MALLDPLAVDYETEEEAKSSIEKDDLAFKRKEYYDKLKQNKQKFKDDFLALYNELVDKNFFEQLSDAAKTFLANEFIKPAKEKKARALPAQRQTIFNKLFGENPVVGTSITLEEVFRRTFKGKSALDFYIKKWAEKGIIVEYTINQQEPLATEYVLKHYPVPID